MSEPDSAWSPQAFDRLYAANPDPWDFATSPYEAAKYEATIAALPFPRFRAAFEVGCSIGVLTRQLAERCDHLLAVDVAEAAVEQARVRCARLPHVNVQRMHVPDEWPEGQFELILLSEVLYYFKLESLDLLAQRVTGSLTSGGAVLMVHWTGPTDALCTGDEATSRFLMAAGHRLRPATDRREPKYRMDLLFRSS